LVGVESKDRVIEHIESIHAELCFHPFGDRKVLKYRRISKERTRPPETIHPDIAEIPSSWVSKRSAAIGCDVGDWSEELPVRIAVGGVLQRTRTGVERPRPMTWTAYAHVLFISAITEARSPREATTPVGRTRNLPPTDE
jgi:hypothetical protein